ncbi:MAG: AAA family ATPase [Deltaproteobacteria bacterium]|nr:AAA family ATPase [Deltaproteobacteria bacterium]
MALPELIAAMLRPEFYPHRPAAVELVQSHISYVLLAGDQVYKLKKAVRFSFLDFSTLARRHHFCHQEVRLNRRLAAEVYLGVVAICRGAAGYRLGADGDPEAVEYAVHMHRLPDDRTLDRLLDRGEVTAAMIERIAARLAAFHAQADCGDEVTANGDPAAIWQVLGENYAGVRPFRGVTAVAADDDAIQDFSRDFLARNAPLFRRRQSERRIRECHGDLHSEHICFTNGLVIFDCIEFNQRFRYCDVASDVAFLAMDLEYHGRPDLADHLVARYAAESGDEQIKQLVPFYACYRAYVRGKVDSLKSAEAEVGDDQQAAARASARHHFALAYRYTWGSRPGVVALCGLSGSGKSSIAAALAERTGYRHVSSDIVRKEIAGLPPSARVPEDYAAGLYSPEHSAATYGALLARTQGLIGAGRGVILDATFQRRSDREALRQLAQALSVALLFVECRCHEQEIRRRLDQRAGEDASPSDAGWNVYLEQRRGYQPFGADERADHLVVDTSGAAAEPRAAIERALRELTRTRL